jgi:hypothetical protein
MKVCWFSTGVSSLIACYLTHDIDKIIYTHIDSQHPDSLRFLHDCEKLLGKKIEILQSEKYKTVDEVIEKKRYINGIAGAACTLELKKRVRQKWELENGIGYTYIWGYDINEKHRAERVIESMPEFHHEFPLIQHGLTKQNCHELCERIGLKRPAMYDLGYPNNNCIGCVKGGMGYWNKIRKDFPEVFARRAQQEREIGHSCINGVFLDELDPNRGDMGAEIMPECGIACYITMNQKEANHE